MSRRFVTFLPVCVVVLLANVVNADQPVGRDDKGVNDLDAVLDRSQKNIGSKDDHDDDDEIESFFLLSMNHPTKLSFRYSETPGVKVDAVIERLTSEATRKSLCTFPVFGYEPTVHHIRLMSTGNDTEILQIVEISQEPMNNSMTIFVLNITDCQHKRTEILKGYDYFATGGSFTVLHPGGDGFDIFSLNGQKDCGSYICKRTYNIENNSISEPTKFTFLEQHQDQILTYMAPSVGDGYFSIVKQNNNISLYSLTSEGGIVKSIENNTELQVHFLKISTDHGYFSFCYTTETKLKEMHCMQLDKNLNCFTNVTFDLAYETSYLAVQNLPQGGFLMLTMQCANSTDCTEHQITITRFDADGFHGEFNRFSDTGCIPRRQQQFTFFEENEKICVFYACDFKKIEGNGYNTVIKSRCF